MSDLVAFLSKYGPAIAIFMAGLIGAGATLLQTVRNDEAQAKLETRSAYEAAEHLATGELSLNFTPTFTPSDEFYLDFGMGMGLPTSRILQGKIFVQLLPSINYEPIKIEIKNQKLVISLKIFDPDGNLIAEVRNNHWRPYRNFYGMFNYDDNGFEVIDNQGNVAISIDVQSSNRVAIQGVFRSRLKKIMVISAGKSFRSYPFLNKEEEVAFEKQHGRNYNEEIDSLISTIKPIFEYWGKDWLHKRLDTTSKVLTNSFFNPNAHPLIRPTADFFIPLSTNVIVHFNGKDYLCNVSSVDHMKPERVLFRVSGWKNDPGVSTMMVEKNGGANADEWTNSRPLDIHDPEFIKAAIKVLKNLLSNKSYPVPFGLRSQKPPETGN